MGEMARSASANRLVSVRPMISSSVGRVMVGADRLDRRYTGPVSLSVDLHRVTAEERRHSSKYRYLIHVDDCHLRS